MNVNYDIKKDYENETLGDRGKNKPKQTQSQNRQNEHNFFYNNELRTNNYERCQQKQSQTNPNKPNLTTRLKTEQTQSEFIPKAAQFHTGPLLGILKPGTYFKSHLRLLHLVSHLVLIPSTMAKSGIPENIMTE